ncbi:MAG: hypothetical protein NVSMB32_17800 [Actinomycetota bacterium]
MQRPRFVRLEGVIGHRTRHLDPEDRAEIKGIPVTTPLRTIVDLASLYSAPKLGAMLDHALAHRLFARADLETRAALLRCPQAAVLGTLLAERPSSARPLGSQFEAGLFRALRSAGLPLPVPQYRVTMPDGCDRYLDFAYPEIKLAIEADSFLWHASLEAWQRERVRNNEAVALGWSILPITYDLVMHHPAEVARQVGMARQSRMAG